MALVTRCPNCATTFRVTPLHLQAHGGEVRCGQCAQVFNGFATLMTIQDLEAIDLVKAKEAGEMPASVTEVSTDASNAAASFDSPQNRSTASDEPALPEQAVLPAVPGPEIIQDKVPEEAGAKAGAEADARETAASETPLAEKPASKKARKANNSFGGTGRDNAETKEKAWRGSEATDSMLKNHALENYRSENDAFDSADSAYTAPWGQASLGWSIASFFLLIVLAAQIIYLYRTELSVIAPGTKPFLEQYCKLFQCTVSMPNPTKLLGIESSGMEADKRYPGVIALNAVVRNHAPYPQAFPLFQLTLIDSRDPPLASAPSLPVRT
jgi:predicted Zn finger-like uncharacterized protein